MVKCKLCGKEYKDKRGLNAHMLKAHMEEYKKAGYKLAVFMDGEPEKPERKKEENSDPKNNTNIRPLNVADAIEKSAYDAGYRFVDDDDNLYTIEDMKGVK